MGSPVGAGGATYRVGGAEGPVDTVYLGAFRREALDAVGGYDPRMTRNQDAELNLRLTAAGYRVWFDPELAVDYRPRADLPSLARQYWEYGRWRRRTARLHPGSLAARQLAPPALVAGLTAAILASAVTRRGGLAAVPAAGYGLGLLAAGWQAAPRRALVVPTAAALGTMHLAWGLGFLAGPPRNAVPLTGAADVP
jgi:succinoglycan biosynthesis protein ExoA